VGSEEQPGLTQARAFVDPVKALRCSGQALHERTSDRQNHV